jgi:ribosomal protein S19
LTPSLNTESVSESVFRAASRASVGFADFFLLSVFIFNLNHWVEFSVEPSDIFGAYFFGFTITEFTPAISTFSHKQALFFFYLRSVISHSPNM